MRRTLATAFWFLAVPLLAACEEPVALPSPQVTGSTSLEATLAARRSLRRYAGTPLSRAEIGQLCWAAQGATGTGPSRRLRTAPSAGALYPLELYVATAQGLWHYDPAAHRLDARTASDLRRALQGAALGQDAIGSAPAVFVLTGVEARSAGKYGARATRYVWMEAGHAAQNLLLQATASGLGGVPIGAFHDDRVARVLALPAGEVPLCLIPVGHPAPE